MFMEVMSQSREHIYEVNIKKYIFLKKGRKKYIEKINK